MITRLQVPNHLHRNDAGMEELGYERTGQVLIELAMNRVGLESLQDTDILDVGCGVRFVMSILNCGIRIKCIFRRISSTHSDGSRPPFRRIPSTLPRSPVHAVHG